jgi:hypothetical protein
VPGIYGGLSEELRALVALAPSNVTFTVHNHIWRVQGEGPAVWSTRFMSADQTLEEWAYAIGQVGGTWR